MPAVHLNRAHRQALPTVGTVRGTPRRLSQSQWRARRALVRVLTHTSSPTAVAAPPLHPEGKGGCRVGHLRRLPTAAAPQQRGARRRRAAASMRPASLRRRLLLRSPQRSVISHESPRVRRQTASRAMAVWDPRRAPTHTVAVPLTMPPSGRASRNATTPTQLPPPALARHSLAAPYTHAADRRALAGKRWIGGIGDHSILLEHDRQVHQLLR